METFYSILGVNQQASLEEIKKQYRLLAKKYHPDRNKSADASDMFKKISTAYETLKDPQKREEYNQSLMYQSVYTGRNQDHTDNQWFSSDLDNLFDFIFKKTKEDPKRNARKKQQDQDINDILNGRYHRQTSNNAKNQQGFNFSPEHMFRDPTEEEMNVNFQSWDRTKRTQNQQSTSSYKAVPVITLDLSLNECIEGTIRSIIDEETGKEIKVRIPKGITPENTLKIKEPRIDIHIKPKFRKWKFIDGDVHLTIPSSKFNDKEFMNVETILGEKIKLFKPKDLKEGTKMRVKNKGWLKPNGERTNMIITFS
jgi:DnaJ-class molecular chaperone